MLLALLALTLTASDAPNVPDAPRAARLLSKDELREAPISSLTAQQLELEEVRLANLNGLAGPIALTASGVVTLGLDAAFLAWALGGLFNTGSGNLYAALGAIVLAILVVAIGAVAGLAGVLATLSGGTWLAETAVERRGAGQREEQIQALRRSRVALPLSSAAHHQRQVHLLEVENSKMRFTGPIASILVTGAVAALFVGAAAGNRGDASSIAFAAVTSFAFVGAIAWLVVALLQRAEIDREVSRLKAATWQDDDRPIPSPPMLPVSPPAPATPILFQAGFRF